MVSGSRRWSDRDAIGLALATIHASLPAWEPRILIHGDCDGADKIADNVARAMGWGVVPYAAEWGRYGYDAGKIRNLEMLRTNPDLVLAFPLAGSRGTWHAFALARRRGIEAVVIG